MHGYLSKSFNKLQANCFTIIYVIIYITWAIRNVSNTSTNLSVRHVSFEILKDTDIAIECCTSVRHRFSQKFKPVEGGLTTHLYVLTFPLGLLVILQNLSNLRILINIRGYYRDSIS